eukprot:2680447-Prymnesium_polylepis.1
MRPQQPCCVSVSQSSWVKGSGDIVRSKSIPTLEEIKAAGRARKKAAKQALAQEEALASGPDSLWASASRLGGRFTAGDHCRPETSAFSKLHGQCA